MRLFEGTALDRPPRCERCNALEPECNCPPPAPVVMPPSQQTARLSLEKRKRGKLVTLIQGLAAGHPEPHFSQLLTRLKNSCGAGGSIAGDYLEIQGDHRETIAKLLRQSGYRVKD